MKLKRYQLEYLEAIKPGILTTLGDTGGDELEVSDSMATEHLPGIRAGRRIEHKKPWPLLARPLKLMAKPEDRGLGDIVARTVGPVGGDAFKAWFVEAFGRDCGCGDRQVWLNIHFPLP